MDTKTSRTVRASRISAVALPEGGRLMQWNCSYTMESSLDTGLVYKSVVSSFRSLVTRPGHRGIWLDLPYYCAAGQHTYRRLPFGLELKVRVACVRGEIHKRIGLMVDVVLRQQRRLGAALRRLTPSEIRARRQAAHEMRQLLDWIDSAS